MISKSTKLLILIIPSSFFLCGVHLCHQSIFAKLVDWIANSDHMRLSLSLIENDQILLIHIFSLDIEFGDASQWTNLLAPWIGGCSVKTHSGVVSSYKATILMWLSLVLSMLFLTNQIPYNSCFYYFWRYAVKWCWREHPAEALNTKCNVRNSHISPRHPIWRGFPRAQHPSKKPPPAQCIASLQDASLSVT